MSDKARRMAEAVASVTTRRRFLGRLTRLAGGAAAVVAGVLATRSAHAGRGGNGPAKANLCCVYWYGRDLGGWDVYWPRCTQRKSCLETWHGAPLVEAYEIENCEDCI
jgi:hypothetical protein